MLDAGGIIGLFPCWKQLERLERLKRLKQASIVERPEPWNGLLLGMFKATEDLNPQLKRKILPDKILRDLK